MSYTAYGGCMTPNQPREGTSVLSIRMDDTLRADLQARADREGVPLSETVRRILHEATRRDVAMQGRDET